ncbi:MAG: hypothetical protein KU28_00205 [Sulfurovum sp. PC08-66]|nr:MAG: hypothetical protein KU28_00205 [Sulfurovum sp. PC08-66]KIM12393.1 MAG: hypothetical protein KU37_00325 [Sulfuricurvum sp. PC08-66]
MRHHLLAISALISLFFFQGCQLTGDACAAQVGMDLDEGKYDQVIAALENNGTCQGALTQEEAWLDLGAAYMGLAGVKVSKLFGVVSSMLEGGMDTGTLVSAFPDAASGAGLDAITQAQKVYGYILDGVNCDASGKSAFQEAACTYDEFANTVKMTAVMNLSMGSGAASLTEPIVQGSAQDVNDNNTSDELEVMSCSMGGTCAGSITTVASSNVPFSKTGFSATYTPTTYTVASIDTNVHPDALFYRLIDPNSTPVGPVTTDGMCKNDFTTCTDINFSLGCYPCPVVIDGAAVPTTEVLLDIVNTDPMYVAMFDTNGDGNVSSDELAAAMSGG